jgi:hypothetical protein
MVARVFLLSTSQEGNLVVICECRSTIDMCWNSGDDVWLTTHNHVEGHDPTLPFFLQYVGIFGLICWYNDAKHQSHFIPSMLIYVPGLWQ